MNLKEKQKYLDRAIKNEACSDALEWIEKTGLENVNYNNIPSDYALWAVGKIDLPCTSEQLERWGNEYPRRALEYCSDKCTSEQLDRWGNEDPYTALKYCSDKCTSEQLERWGNEYPGTTLIYCSDKCTPEQFERWKKC